MDISKIIRRSVFTLFYLGVLLIILPNCSLTDQNKIEYFSIDAAEMPQTKTKLEEDSFEWISKDSPLYLLQTDFFEYQFLNPVSQKLLLFSPPPISPQFRLQPHQSPSGKLMFFPQNEIKGVIIDLQTGETVFTYDFTTQAQFEPRQAASTARSILKDLNLNETDLIQALKQAHLNSTQLFSWYRDDQHFISVKDSSVSSTSLFLTDLKIGNSIQLEDHPGLVKNISISSDSNLILLEKGFIFMPAANNDNNFYLIDVNEPKSIPIQLPENIFNPFLFWISEDLIGVIHETHLSGGAKFSLYNINTNTLVQIINEGFYDLRQFADKLLIFRKTIEHFSLIDFYSFEGELLGSQSFDQNCHFYAALSDAFVMQCTTNTYIIDKNLQAQPLFDTFTILSPAPNGHSIVTVNRSGQSFLLDANFNNQFKLDLKETPLEIIWLPNSNGFMYRVLGSLHYYDIINQTDYFLFESDLLSDYTNLNIVLVPLS